MAHHERIFDYHEDLQHLKNLMWRLSREIEPQFADIARQTCRFDAVWSAGWKPFRNELLKAIRTQVEHLKAKSVSGAD